MERNKISNLQIKALVVTTTIGGGILSLPSELSMILDTGGWLAIIISGLITIPFIIMIDKLFKIYPGKNFFEIGREVINPIIFNLFLLIILSYTLILLIFISRIFADVIKAYLLETTPIEVIIITMLFAISYMARSQIEDIARMSLIIYPIVIGFVIFLVVVNLPNMDYTNIYPIFDIDYKALPKGVLAAFFAYAGFEFIILSIPFAEDSKKTLSYSLRGIFLVIGIYLIIYFVTLSQYGVSQLKREIWPTVAVIKEVNLPGYFLENLDGIVIAVWVMVVFGTMAPFLHSSGVILSDIFKTKTYEIFIIPLIPIIYIFTLLPRNLVQTYKVLGNLLSYFFIAAILIVPTIILILAYIKKGRKKV